MLDVIELVRRVPQPAAVGETRRGYRCARWIERMFRGRHVALSRLLAMTTKRSGAGTGRRGRNRHGATVRHAMTSETSSISKSPSDFDTSKYAAQHAEEIA